MVRAGLAERACNADTMRETVNSALDVIIYRNNICLELLRFCLRCRVQNHLNRLSEAKSRCLIIALSASILSLRSAD